MKSLDDKFAEMIIEKMKKVKMRQDELARRVDTSQSNISRFLTRKKTITFEIGLKICFVLTIDSTSILQLDHWENKND